MHTQIFGSSKVMMVLKGFFIQALHYFHASKISSWTIYTNGKLFPFLAIIYMQQKLLNYWDADTKQFFFFFETLNHVQAHANVFIFNEEHSMKNSKIDL